MRVLSHHISALSRRLSCVARNDLGVFGLDRFLGKYEGTHLAWLAPVSFVGVVAAVVFVRRRYYFDMVKLIRGDKPYKGDLALVLEPWSDRWAEEFAMEKARIEAALSPFEALIDRTHCPNGIVHIGWPVRTASQGGAGLPSLDPFLCQYFALRGKMFSFFSRS